MSNLYSNKRLNALRVLKEVIEDKTPLSQIVTSKHLSPYTKELCYGVCRQYFRLEAIADALLKTRPTSTEVWLCILIGLYQLHYLRTPAYAVVKETVDIMDQIEKPRAKGLVNAVLRTYCREHDTLLKKISSQSIFQNNHPEWLVARIQRAWPDDWQIILKTNDSHPPMCLRVNATRNDTISYLERLESLGIRAHPHPVAPCCIELENPCPVVDLPGFMEGDVSIQDPAAQIAAPLLKLEPDLRVLDACCAPGGKTCHILETEPDLSNCTALDIANNRLELTRDNLKRLNLNATIINGDACDPSQWWDGIPFDRILLDAPCSGIGVIRRNPDIKILRNEAALERAINLQRHILRSLWPLLAPGGIMIYATCSIMPEENELQIARFVKSKTDCVFLDEKQPWGRPTGHGWQILPGERNMDGFFYSILKRNIN